MNVLINGVGGPTPRSVARSLHRHSSFQDISIIGTDINPLAYGLYENDLYSKTYVIPPAGKKGYWEAIEKIVAEHNISMALVQPELEVLAWTKRQKSDANLPCKALLPDHDLVKLLVDKSLMTQVLASTGLVPKSVNIDPREVDYERIEQELNYPFWIRSTSGSSGLGSLKVEDRSSLKNWLTINPEVEQFIASTFLPGRNLACKVLYHNGELLRSACGERVNYIMSKTAPSGITGNTSFGRLINEPELVRQTKQAMDILFKHVGVKPHGFFTADYKEDASGKAYITEINVRMVAFNLSFAAAGANFSEDIVRLLNEDPAFDRSYKMYEFEKDLIFLRDVDAEPILMKESDLLKKLSI